MSTGTVESKSAPSDVRLFGALSAVTFYCELDKRDGLKIPLGYIAEIVVGNLRGLGMLARVDLTDIESQRIGELGRRLLDPDPSVYLGKLFDDAWEKSTPEHALAYLSERHHISLRFEVPTSLEVPKAPLVVQGTPVRSKVREWLLDQLAQREDDLLPVGLKPEEYEIPEELWESGAVSNAA